MELKINRERYNADSTIGRLYINDVFHCFTLEDKVRDANRDGDLSDVGEAKVYGKTAIPAGRYEVIVSFSNNFKRRLPLLVNVKGFEGVRLHGGNTEADTLGCPLLGRDTDWKKIWNCASVVNSLIAILEKATKKEKIFITITDVKN